MIESLLIAVGGFWSVFFTVYGKKDKDRAIGVISLVVLLVGIFA